MSKLPIRSEVPIQDTWDLTTIFPTDEAWEKELVSLKADYAAITKFQGQLLTSAATLEEALKLYEDLVLRLNHLYVYAHLSLDTDTANPHYQGYLSQVTSVAAEVSAALVFIKTELMASDEALVFQYLKENQNLSLYEHFFKELFQHRDHILSLEIETVLAQASEVMGTASEVFSTLNNADLRFGTIKDESGNEVELSHGRYGVFMESLKRDVRKDAFKTLYLAYQNHINTFATTLRGQVKNHNLNARLRKYPSARAAALANNFIPETVYDALVSAVNQGLPLLHRYVALRKKSLKVDEMRMYDMYVPFVEPIDLKFTYQEAQEIILEALGVLGKDYYDLLKMAFEKRWIDVIENQGKRSGAYSSGTYGTNPYILLNWNNTLDNVFTLAHELGHSVHSYYTRASQPFVYGDYSIFLAEVASTTNENLLTDYLLKKYSDPKIQAYIINHFLDGFKGTVFRQTQFAEFEHLIHTLDQEGIALTPDLLSKHYGEINAKYYGPEMVYDDEISIEWSRIPHFYYNYYVYQYATGFSAASALSKKILEEGQPAIDAYFDFLKAGSSDYPIDVLKKAGVDMSSNQATKDALEVFEMYLEKLEELD